MATYQELRTLFNNSDLLEKVEVATIIAANSMLSGTPTTAQKAWAAQAFTSPKSEAKKAVMAVLAENSAASVAVITGASDAVVQSSVDNVAQVLVDALAGV